MKILGIIPARGGSKGIPNKNIIDINGKPLIRYTIDLGLEAVKHNIIHELVVSTDDNKIAEVSQKAGLSIPFIRPDHLASDTAKTIDVIIHAYRHYETLGNEFDAIMLLQPTTPLRTFEDIKNSIEIYCNTGASSLISCYREEYICNLVTYQKDEGYAMPLHQDHNKGMRRQDLPDLYVRNGAIYITSADYLLKEHKCFDDKPAMYVMPKERSVNLDSMDDVEMLRWRLSK